MSRVVDGLAIFLLLVAAGAFVYGARSLSEKEDLRALYNLAIGGLALKASVDLLRGRGS